MVPFFAELLEYDPEQDGKGRADDEVESPEQGIDRARETLAEFSDASCDPCSHCICRKVNDDYHGELHAEFVDGLCNIAVFRIPDMVVTKNGLAVDFRQFEFARFTKYVQDYDSYKARHYVSGSCDRKAEAVSALESERLIARTDIVGLARALSESHREQEACSSEHIRHYSER